MKIAVYTIAKNEEGNVEEWAGNVVDADSITFCDTGSTDCTLEIARFNLRPQHIHQISIDPWRFDDAHNAALALVPADADICIPLHLDERLTEGWRDRIEAAWNKSAFWKVKYSQRLYPNSIEYPYKFSDDLTFMQRRIHGRKGFHWRYPTHEGIYPYFDTEVRTVRVEVAEPLIVQKQDLTRLHGETTRHESNLRLLKFGMQENLNDSRMTFYLGREFYYAGRWRDAVTMLQAYLSVDTRNPIEQREAAHVLFKCFVELELAR